MGAMLPTLLHAGRKDRPPPNHYKQQRRVPQPGPGAHAMDVDEWDGVVNDLPSVDDLEVAAAAAAAALEVLAPASPSESEDSDSSEEEVSLACMQLAAQPL